MRKHPKTLSLFLGLSILVVLEFILRFSGFSPLTRSEWSREHGVFSVERYYAQANEHFVRKSDGKCGPAPAMTRGRDSREWAMQRRDFECVSSKKRLVTLGGSSVQGFGIRVEDSITSQLEKKIAWTHEVVNAGVAGYNTLQIRRMLPEIWNLKPEILLLYTGHNDFIFYPILNVVLKDSDFKISTRKIGDNFATWRALRAGMRSLGLLPALPAKIKQPDNQPQFERNARNSRLHVPIVKGRHDNASRITSEERALENIRSFYRENILAIADQAKSRGIKLLLATPISKLNSKPTGSIHWKNLSTNDRKRFRELLSEINKNNPLWPSPIWEEAMAIDDSHAMLMYKAAKAAWRANHRARAIKLWNQSKNAVPHTQGISAPPNFGDWVAEVGKEAGVPVMDLRKELNQELKKSVKADAFFSDIVHPDKQGAKFIAEGAYRKMISLGWVEE